MLEGCTVLGPSSDPGSFNQSLPQDPDWTSSQGLSHSDSHFCFALDKRLTTPSHSFTNSERGKIGFTLIVLKLDYWFCPELLLKHKIAGGCCIVLLFFLVFVLQSSHFFLFWIFFYISLFPIIYQLLLSLVCSVAYTEHLMSCPCHFIFDSCSSFGCSCDCDSGSCCIQFPLQFS